MEVQRNDTMRTIAKPVVLKSIQENSLITRSVDLGVVTVLHATSSERDEPFPGIDQLRHVTAQICDLNCEI